MTNTSETPAHTLVAARIHASLTGPKKSRMTLEEVDHALAELLDDAQDGMYRRGRSDEAAMGTPRLGHIGDHIAARLGPMAPGVVPRLVPGTSAWDVCSAIVDELEGWRRFDRSEQDRIRRLGERVTELLAGIRLIAELVGKGQTTHLVGEHGPAMSMSAVLSGIASKLHTMMLHEIQHPRWRNEGGNRPPEDAVAKYIVGGEQ